MEMEAASNLPIGEAVLCQRDGVAETSLDTANENQRRMNV